MGYSSTSLAAGVILLGGADIGTREKAASTDVTVPSSLLQKDYVKRRSRNAPMKVKSPGRCIRCSRHQYAGASTLSSPPHLAVKHPAPHGAVQSASHGTRTWYWGSALPRAAGIARGSVKQRGDSIPSEVARTGMAPYGLNPGSQWLRLRLPGIHHRACIS